MLSLREVLDGISNAELMQGAADLRFEAVSTDSRQISPGDLFVALTGERFDGHNFSALASAQGAAALLVSRKVDTDLPAILVPDTRIAFGELARLWRRRFAIPVIAVVGSNGKTTTKEMIASILRTAFGAEGYLATAGNLNNDIGVPMTLLKLKTRHAAAVIEIGMNHPGETAWLSAITEPTITVVTNAQREHQEFMASVAAVASEHALAVKALPEDGIAVLPAADPYLNVWRKEAGSRRVIDYISFASRSDQAAADDGSTALAAVAYVAPFNTVAHFTFEEHTVTARLATAGMHNVHNAAAAAGAAFAAHVDAIDIGAGLERFVPVSGRMQKRTHAGGGLLIDDTYNANPDSVLAAIAVLVDSPAPRLLVLGDMGEVGHEGIEFHREIGRVAASSGIALMALGALAVHAVHEAAKTNASDAQHFAAMPDMIAALHAWLSANPPQASVLVKGSRFMQMERVSQQISQSNGLKSTAGSH